MTKKELTLILSMAAVALNQNITEQKIIAWYQLFFNEDAEIFSAAMNAVIKESNRKFFPTPGELTAAMEALKPQVENAALVWDRLITYAQQSMDWLRVEAKEFENKATISAIKQVEWNKIRYSDIEKDLPILKAQFIRFYNQHNDHQKRVEAIQLTHNENKLLQDLGLTKKMGAISQ
jgi:hypothetical protein